MHSQRLAYFTDTKGTLVEILIKMSSDSSMWGKGKIRANIVAALSKINVLKS